MSRPIRIEYPGAWYHVMNRGARREVIFKSDKQRQYFLSLLSETTRRFNAEWHAYCLMDNHYHLLIRTPEGNLQRIMRHLNGVYTQYFNRSEGKDGSLFRGRYKAILVDEECYWLQLSRYVHRNPVEANLVRSLEKYRWSSYPAYIGIEPPEDWLEINYILRAIGQRNVQNRYKAYVLNSEGDEITQFYSSEKLCPILGDEDFKKNAMSGITLDPEFSELRQVRYKPHVMDMVERVKAYYEVNDEDIWSKTRGRGIKSPARYVAMLLAQEVCELTLKEIAGYFDLSSFASAGSTIRSVRRKSNENSDLSKAINYIKQGLTP
jgi:putative transposase